MQPCLLAYARAPRHPPCRQRPRSGGTHPVHDASHSGKRRSTTNGCACWRHYASALRHWLQCISHTPSPAGTIPPKTLVYNFNCRRAGVLRTPPPSSPAAYRTHCASTVRSRHLRDILGRKTPAVRAPRAPHNTSSNLNPFSRVLHRLASRSSAPCRPFPSSVDVRQRTRVPGVSARCAA